MDFQRSTFLDAERPWYGRRPLRANKFEARFDWAHGMSFFSLLFVVFDQFCGLQYLIMNLGMSTNFGFVDLAHLTFPAHMRVDYIRVYQPKDAINIGCDPKAFPTKAYIEEYVQMLQELLLYT